MRVTCRSTGPFEVFGSPVCSQIAIDRPFLTIFAIKASAAWYGTPAIGIDSPFDLLRAVRVISKSSAAFLASSKKSS